MKPDKIFLTYEDGYTGWGIEPDKLAKENVEYIRKDISDEAIKSAEDHAYFAGQEKFREKMLEWAKEQIEHHEKMLKNYPTEREYMAFVGAFQSMIDKLKTI